MKDQRRRQREEYRTLQTVREEEEEEHQRDDASSSSSSTTTDVDLEALDFAEKDYMHGPAVLRMSKPERESGFFTLLKEYWWIFNTFLLLVIIVLLMDKSWSRRGKEHYFEGAGDITGFVPEFSQKITTFSPDPGFVPENTSEFFTEETRRKWLDLVPKGLGYLQIENPDQYDNLPAALASYPDRFVVTSSVTHQLQCLHSIAEAYSALSSSGGSRAPAESAARLSHCFDYLRQGILCSGDVALEGSASHSSSSASADSPDGWDAKHVCKNYPEVREYLEQNRADDRVWI
ncbi:hypothetical protein GGS23DRAFT_2514 [Durotheca rogersii]|uniref:uncharacterized protein n=1 Tax=Durotheca rogersii TaxID=419775 RepID=UPI00221FFEAC|nr:uncharacterized protein GGS23DRAFT_2514 [Durotheca rogersii]KAI5867933.1 hypothetical protein GGS23DRAFT_2514 [Durotheca rogersii]